MTRGPDGVVRIGQLTPDKLPVVVRALDRSAALAEDERQVGQVFDTVEPRPNAPVRKRRTSPAAG